VDDERRQERILEGEAEPSRDQGKGRFPGAETSQPLERQKRRQLGSSDTEAEQGKRLSGKAQAGHPGKKDINRDILGQLDQKAQAEQLGPFAGLAVP